MSRPIAYNASGPLSGSIRGGNVNYTVDSGNRDYTTFASKKWVPSADGAAPIVFVTDTYTQGFELNPSLAVPLFYSCAGTGSAAIVYTANRVPGSPGNYSDANVALNDLITARGYFILESNDPFEGVDADSLALDLDASKMSSYPQTGTSWRDLSGNGITNALVNGPTWNSNGWFTFDGTDDYGINTNSLLNITGNVTINAWIRHSGTGDPYGNYASKDANLGYRMRRDGTSGSPLWLYASGNNTVGGAIYDNLWYMVTGVFSSTGLRGYINGNLVASNSNPYASTPSGPFYIGAFVVGSELFGGNMMGLQVYNKALTQSDIKQNYFGAPIVTDGLVFAVDANNIVSYPKSGTAWYNLTGSITNGSLVNGPTFSPVNGGSIVFDGTDDYVNVSNGMNALVGTNQVTFSAWIRRSSTTSYWAGIISNKINLAEGIALLVNPTSKIFFQYDSTSGVYAIDGGATLETNVWYNIVGIYDNVGLKTYLNGVLNDSAADAGKSIASAGNMDIVIGAHQPISSYFPGEIANVKIYNRGLTAAEVLQNYQSEQYRFETSPGIPTNGLILHLDATNRQSYPGSGTVWYDISGQGANADLVNGVTWNSSGYFFFDGTDDIANSINISQEYRDLVIGIWSESNGGLEMVFSLYGGFDASFRLSNNVLNAGGGNSDDWQFGSSDLVFIDGTYNDTTNLGSQFHFVRTYRSNNADFGTSFRYSLSSTFLSRFFKGKIAFVLCYNRQLSDAEVRGLYYYYKDRFPF
jgi:hypothetical protein